MDTSRTEEVLGIRFRSFEDQVVEVTRYYLELVEKAGKSAEEISITYLYKATAFKIDLHYTLRRSKCTCSLAC